LCVISFLATSRFFYSLLLLLCLCSNYLAFAQEPKPEPTPAPTSGRILNDSIKQVYGPQTSRYISESDLLNNRDTTYAADTLLNNIHNYNFVNRFDNRYVDLGNLGTALRPVFYKPPAQIGTYFGVDAYSPYAYTPDNVRYYDTKSPYTHLQYVQGGLFQQLFNVGHSRNINPRWNIGFDYQRIVSSKQYGYQPPQGREERHADQHAVVFYTRWISKDSTYHILGHFSHLNHFLNDQGGLLLPNIDRRSQEGLLNNFAENGSSQLAPSRGGQQLVRSNDFRNHWHLYHQYKFGNGFQVYHIFDRQMQRYSYQDLQPRYPDSLLATVSRPNRRFYPDVFLASPTRTFYYLENQTRDQMRFVLYENRFGLKGTYQGWDYRLYARRRDFSVTYSGEYPVFQGIPYANPTNSDYAPVQVRRGETFLGAWGQYRFRNNIRLFAEAEYLLFRDYKLSGTFESPWFKAGYLSMLHSPTLVQQRMSGNHFRWNNNFSNVSVNQLFGQLILNYRSLRFEPSLTITNLANYVYFDQAVQPQQSTPFQIINAGATLAFHGKVFHAVNEVIFTQTTTSADAIRMPQWFINARWYAEGYLFKKALYMQLGVEGHYKSDYRGDAYMPAIGQFHLQDNFLIHGYPVLDVFANARVGRVRLMAKMSHVNQNLWGSGYFITPYYPGQRRTFGFGVIWPLFD